MNLLLLLPVGLMVSFLPLPHAAFASRVLLLISVSGAVPRLHRLRHLESQWACLLILFVVANVASAMFSMDVTTSLLDCGRQAYVALFSILLVVSVRKKQARLTVARGMIVATLVGMMAIVYLYSTFGFGFTLEGLKEFKASVWGAMPEFAVNPLAEVVTLSFFLSMPALSRYMAWILGALFLPLLLITGARSAILAIPMSVLLLVGIQYLRKHRAATLLLTIGLAFTCIYFYFWNGRMDWLASAAEKLSGFTTNRSYLWLAAVERFFAHPWVGGGGDTWRLDLPTFLPTMWKPWLFRNFSNLAGGAYHNAYLTYLAERGLIGFIPGLMMILFVLRSALRLYSYRRILAGSDRVSALLAPLAVLFIVVRQCVEAAGVLGYANGAGDFICFVVVSMVIALAADPDGCVSKQPYRFWRTGKVLFENPKGMGYGRPYGALAGPLCYRTRLVGAGARHSWGPLRVSGLNVRWLRREPGVGRD